MEFVIDRLQFLGLNSREIKVFTSLSTFGRMNMTKVASRSDLPRTTVDAIIRRLLKQGLISKEKVRGHYEYFVSTDDVADKLDWIEKRFRKESSTGGETETKKQENIDDNENIVKIEAASTSLSDIAAQHSGDRVRLLLSRGQGGNEERALRFSKYAAIAIENNLKLEILLDITIADTLVGKGSVPIPPRSDMIRLNIVPAVYGVAVEDVFMFRDSMLLIGTHNNERRVVKERVLVSLSKHLLDIACEAGWSVDLTAWMNKDL